MMREAPKMSKEKQTLIEQLEQISARIRAFDLEAGRQLHDTRDRQKYREILLEKTELLASLPELTRAGAKALPEEQAAAFEQSISELAEDAMQAMTIGSVFYMSVLLLPEEEQPESPNDLEKLIGLLRA